MKIEETHWKNVEAYLKSNDLGVLPLGCTEQHAYLSLATDSILAHKVATEAAAPLGVPVFPVLAYGLTPSFKAFPGTISLSAKTYLTVIEETLTAMVDQGFKRILIVNGHGGNAPARSAVLEVMGRRPESRIKWHDWWIGPKTWKAVSETDPDAAHASWMENFPWTRLAPNLSPAEKKPMVDIEKSRTLPPNKLKDLIGDGSYGGLYQRPDEQMFAIWKIAVEEVRSLMEVAW